MEEKERQGRPKERETGEKRIDREKESENGREEAQKAVVLPMAEVS